MWLCHCSGVCHVNWGGAHIGMGEKTAWTEKNDKILKWETGRARYKMKTAMEGITTDNSVKNYICIK